MKIAFRIKFVSAALFCEMVFKAAFAQSVDPLPSWNEGKAKEAIVEFVLKVTTEGGAEFVPPAERIATFDNDGTLWVEQPLYIQILFAVDRVKDLAPAHPEWQQQEPFKSVLAGDLAAALAGGHKSLIDILGAGGSNMIYQPMLEVLAYLRANGFKTYIASGGGVDFMRAFEEQVYGIPPEQVIGSTGQLQFEMRGNEPQLIRLPALDFFDDKEGKPIAIQRHIGRRPIGAFGNSDGDLQMLQWTCAGEGTRFCLFVRHTDAEREWNYDVTPLGRLEKGLDEASAKGWTVVDMKKDWKVIYPFERK